MHFGLYQLALMVTGGLGLAGGLLLLWNVRTDIRSAAEDLTSQQAQSKGASPSTRYIVAIVLLILGYHGVVWALPPSWVEVQFPRTRWLFVLLGSAAICLGSILLDRFEALSSSK